MRTQTKKLLFYLDNTIAYALVEVGIMKLTPFIHANLLFKQYFNFLRVVFFNYGISLHDLTMISSRN